MGVGEAAIDKKYLESAKSDLTAIAGQAIITYARKSVAASKSVKGGPWAVKLHYEAKGCLTSSNVWLMSLFQGKEISGLNPKSFDEQGNYN